MLTAEFFEDYSLYKKVKVEVPDNNLELRLPAIHLECPQCKRITTFTTREDRLLPAVKQSQYYGKTVGPWSLAGKNCIADYECSSCRDYRQTYYLYFTEDLSHVMKIGQYPVWTKILDKPLKELLGESEGLFRRGYDCEFEGYGIGATAYYRRVLENVIDKLLDEIGSSFGDQDDSAYTEKLMLARRSTIAQDKLELIREFVPKSLRPNNINPADMLYEALSKGIHVLSDEECLENAQDIRTMLQLLVNGLQRAKQEREEFRLYAESAKRILDDKARKSKTSS